MGIGTVIGIIMALALVVFIVSQIIKKKKNNNEGVDIVITPGTPGKQPTKKALLVGINIYKPELGSNLRGCVNDVENIRELLVNYFGFNPENIRVIINERATKLDILERLGWLLSETVSGDELVFHYSGHGSQVRDRHGDELDDDLDEILCPHDLNWDDPLTDDILATLFDKVPVGVNLTMISDSCHSGTITRDIGCNGNMVDSIPKRIIPPYDIRSRSLGLKIQKKRNLGMSREIVQNHVLLSGCKDNQTSSDAYIGGKYQGALSWALTTAIKENPNMTWLELHKIITDKLKSYTQDPQLSGNDVLLNRKIFGGSIK